MMMGMIIAPFRTYLMVSPFKTTNEKNPRNSQNFGINCIISLVWPSDRALKLVSIDRELYEDSHASKIVKIGAIQRQFGPFCEISKFA